MKVTTDACLFGALLPDAQPTNNVLDIGTGTGLLSLMYAQRFPDASITAIEIEPNAAAQANNNIKNSPFFSKISLYLQDVLTYFPLQKFSVVFCNPPFHTKQLASPNFAKNVAHHQAGLTLPQLFEKANQLLLPEGELMLLLPFYRKNEAIQLGSQFGFSLTNLISFRHSANHAPNRFVGTWQLGTTGIATATSEIIFKNEDQTYSDNFKRLLSPFYLAL